MGYYQDNYYIDTDVFSYSTGSDGTALTPYLGFDPNNPTPYLNNTPSDSSSPQFRAWEQAIAEQTAKLPASVFQYGREIPDQVIGLIAQNLGLIAQGTPGSLVQDISYINNLYSQHYGDSWSTVWVSFPNGGRVNFAWNDTGVDGLDQWLERSAVPNPILAPPPPPTPTWTASQATQIHQQVVNRAPTPGNCRTQYMMPTCSTTWPSRARRSSVSPSIGRMC